MPRIPMSLHRRTVTRRAALFTPAALTAAQAAEPPGAWPGRPIRILAGFAPGGVGDVLARVAAQTLAGGLGVAVTVDGRPGAGGMIAAEACARAAPDGQTLCIGSAPVHSVQPLLGVRRGGFDPAGAFAPVLLIGTEPTVLAVNPAVPARSVAALAGWLRARDPAPFASAGIGTTSHMMGAAMARALGVALVHVPYRGSVPAVTAAMAGEVPIVLAVAGGVLGPLRDGRLVALAVSAAERSPLLPDVPTLQESGLPGLAFTSYQGLFAPAGTPLPIRQRIADLLTEAFQEAGLGQRLAAQGMSVALLGPDAFDAWLRDGEAGWRALVASAGLQDEP